MYGSGTTLNITGGLPLIASGKGSFAGTGHGDTMIGGVGTDTDTLVGGTGNDTYVFFQGMGASVVDDAGGTNTLRFGEGISDQQLWFAQQGNDLLVSVIGTSESVLVKNWYAGSSPPSDSFVDGSGNTLQASQVANLVDAMASYSPPSAGQTTLPSNEATTLDPVIAANWQAA